MNRSESDYERIARAIRFVIGRAGSQPSLAQVAAHVHLSEYHFQRLFSRWAGISPKRFLQALTVGHAKALLRESLTIEQVTDALGLTSASRLHDHFVQLEAVTPGQYRSRGEGLEIGYCTEETIFGPVFIAATERGVCRLAFLDAANLEAELAQLRAQWPAAQLRRDGECGAAVIRQLFQSNGVPDRPLSLLVRGTNFQVSVWRALLRIPPGVLRSYTQVAQSLGCPRSNRAVGAAVAANPVALLIPCHRVIRHNGDMGEYHWGTVRKRALHAWEYCNQSASEDSVPVSLPSNR